MQQDPTGSSTATPTGQRDDAPPDPLEERREQIAVYRNGMKWLRVLEMQLHADGVHSLAYSAKELRGYVHQKVLDLWGPWPELRDGSWQEE